MLTLLYGHLDNAIFGYKLVTYEFCLQSAILFEYLLNFSRLFLLSAKEISGLNRFLTYFVWTERLETFELKLELDDNKLVLSYWDFQPLKIL